MENKYVIVLLGPQGSGKGTQGKKLAEKLGIPYLETGQLLRDAIASGSEQGKYISSVIDKGNLLSSEFMNKFMGEKITASLTDKGVVLDGFPRRIGQAEFLDRIAPPTHVVLVDISEAESVRRLSARRRCPIDGRIYNLLTAPPQNNTLCDDCQTPLEHRVDDHPEAIKERLAQYHKDTEPVIKYYEDKGVLHRLDGMPDIPEVEKEVWKIFS